MATETDNRRKPPDKAEHSSPILEKIQNNTKNSIANPLKQTTQQPKPHQNHKWRNEKTNSLIESPPRLINDLTSQSDVTTTIITDSSTISIPIITTSPPISREAMPKYKTMPSPTRCESSGAALQLNEIFEEGDGGETTPRSTSRQFVRTSYEQRRSKFHKARTASCSSSDASDDDSEKRKKRAHKLNNPSAKPFQGRRDSHDDSSDSQEPSTGTGGGGGTRTNNHLTVGNVTTNNSTDDGGQGKSNGNSGEGGGKSNNNTLNPTNAMLGRRHKASRRRNGETRLRESQSLNRITEVQEDGGASALVIATSVVGTQGVVNPKAKGLGARILQGLSSTMKKSQEEKLAEVCFFFSFFNFLNL